MTLASIASVAASLFVLGIVLSVVLNINNFAITAQNQFDSIQIFLIDDIDTGEIASFKRKIENIDGVKDVVFESKEMAMEKFKERCETWRKWQRSPARAIINPHGSRSGRCGFQLRQKN